MGDVFTREELKGLLLSVGSHKAERRLSPAEVGLLIERALAAGKSSQELSNLLGIGVTQLKEFVKIAGLSPDVRDMAGWSGRKQGFANTIPFSSLAQLSGLDSVDQRRAAEAILSHALTWKEIVQVMQLHRRAARDLDDCVREVVGMRTEVEIRYVLFGSIDDVMLRNRLAGLVQRDRDELLRSTLPDLGSLSNLVSASRLGSSSFVLVGTADLAASEGTTPEEIERRVLDSLSNKLGNEDG
ncbi:hypothetical protein [Cupriavidus oxalaticus]|uniref:Uncharacterized protein n=1 Tax=Cupriavidus oxalaticus TaxID=96344 RepID=A0A4P7LEK5_9BURK|nr:hypothetical protein [Cupriavidus oxalaticus]QBY54450.1 hypothetical protein E0W60_26005 [Cupriavidus oxalaticus]